MSAMYSKNAVDALNAATSCAGQLGHDHIGAEHILLSILALPECQACVRFVKIGLSLQDLSESMKMMISGQSAGVMQKGQLPLTARTRKILSIAELEAGKSRPVGTEHLVLAMMKEGENAAAQLLFNAGVTVERFESAGMQSSSGDKGMNSGSEARAEDGDNADEESQPNNRGRNGKNVKTPTVNAFGRDLTNLARQGKLDPVIGRKEELKRVVQILSRRNKNNAVLVGEAGVGKTAIAEALAQAIVSGDVPEKMQQRRVVAIDMARVVAGTQYRGQFEERLKKIVDETARAGNIILFLDEIHTMVGAGGSEGAMDAANILKPALARGELQCLGATTIKEFRKSIEKDAALERRFQQVPVDEPSIEDTVSIIEGIAEKYESHHSVRFSPESIRAAVELTARYLPSRQLPDKAIDAIDETGARLRMAASGRPPEIKAMQSEIETFRAKKDEAVSAGDFDSASSYRDKIKTYSAKMEKALDKWRSDHLEIPIDVSSDDIARTVSSMSSVPVEKMDVSGTERLLKLESMLEEMVVGQSLAVAAVAKALRRSKVFPAAHDRPIGSFLFLGPTGVGKTYLAKMLAEKIFGDSKALIRIDMSEYQEKHSSSRLVGAPPGYVGYDEGGQLTEKVRRRPYSVVLFDEFEKANSDVINVLLQILDDGRLTDGQGRVVDFRNTIVICTANLGFDFARDGKSFGFSPVSAETGYEALKEKLASEAKKTFRPELLNRFDEMIVFNKLGKDEIRRILSAEIDALAKQLSKSGISFAIEKNALDFIIDKCYDPALGARPVRRAVQKYVEDVVAEAVLAGKKKKKMTLKLAKDGASLKF